MIIALPAAHSALIAVIAPWPVVEFTAAGLSCEPHATTNTCHYPIRQNTDDHCYYFFIGGRCRPLIG